MTVIYRGRRARRYLGRKAVVSTWWPMSNQEHDRRTAGSAKPGRGGCRKRKVDRAKIRAHIGRDVDRKGWPLRYALRWVMLLHPLAHPLNPQQIAALAAHPVMVLPSGFEFKILAPTVRGRRERRRRAKLRRRRARRRGGWTTITSPPGLLRALASLWWLREQGKRDMQRLLCRTSQTHGA